MKKDFEFLEKFLENNLSPEELSSLELMIASDADLATELHLREEINAAIKEKDIMSLRDKLNTIHAELQKSKTVSVKRIITQNWHLAAASITILVMVGSFLISNLNQVSTEGIYDMYYSSEDAFFTTRSNDGENNHLTIALEKFHNQEYSEAINLLTPISDNFMAQQFLGLAYMETDQFSKAKASFQKILDNKNNIFVEQAKWYKALCLIKLDKEEAAIQLFNSIIEDNNLYCEDATSIITKLK